MRIALVSTRLAATIARAIPAPADASAPGNRVSGAEPLTEPDVPADQGLQQAVAERTALRDQANRAGPGALGAQHRGERQVGGVLGAQRANAVGPDNAHRRARRELIKRAALRAVSGLESASDDDGGLGAGPGGIGERRK